MKLQNWVEQRAGAALATVFGEPVPALARPAQDPKLADYQLNGVLGAAKRLGRRPRETALEVAAHLQKEAAFAQVEVGGPGFVNLRFRPEYLLDLVRAEGTLMAPVDKPERIVVDFSSPNVAKQMHVGHLRSTIIGDSLVRTLRAVGHHVHADNHLGDWGTQFGLLLAGLERSSGTAPQTIQELEQLYARASREAKTDPTFQSVARARLADLQRGDSATVATWQRFVAMTMEDANRLYSLLNTSFDSVQGESWYAEACPSVVERLLAGGIAVEDDGAVCVFFDEQTPLGQAPFIVRKKDGAYLYATTDVATLEYRAKTLQANRALYVVDKRQSLHFQQLAATGERLGVSTAVEHIAFGSVNGKDGKPLRTRDGGVISLASLLEEAQVRAKQRIQEEGLSSSKLPLDELARAVGIGAVKYADLKQNRMSDYRFDWDKMISFRGNSGPYLQYAYARIQSIFRKGKLDARSLHVPSSPETLDPHERELVLRLLQWDDAAHAAASTYQPHLVADHIYQLARTFSTFYEACPVLSAEGAQRHLRLALTRLVSDQLGAGLNLLGVEVVDAM